MDPNGCYSDYCYLTTRVLRDIVEEVGIEETVWSEPRITAERGQYKLDWTSEGGDAITVYDDGCLEVYFCDGSLYSGKFAPLHHKTWANLLVKAGVDPIVAFCSVEFFKELKK